INSNGPGSADFGVCNADLRYHLQVSSQPSGQTCVTRYGAGFVGDSFYPRRLVHDWDYTALNGYPGAQKFVSSIYCTDSIETAAAMTIGFEDMYNSTAAFKEPAIGTDKDFGDLVITLSGNSFTKSVTGGVWKIIAKNAGSVAVSATDTSWCQHPFRVKVYRSGSLVSTAPASGSARAGVTSYGQVKVSSVSVQADDEIRVEMDRGQLVSLSSENMNGNSWRGCLGSDTNYGVGSDATIYSTDMNAALVTATAPQDVGLRPAPVGLQIAMDSPGIGMANVNFTWSAASNASPDLMGANFQCTGLRTIEDNAISGIGCTGPTDPNCFIHPSSYSVDTVTDDYTSSTTSFSKPFMACTAYYCRVRM
ncbi:hypothetical protein EBZ80_27980, partial [bacterium]|nr:hypothetical protein [bacterium]